MPVLLAIDWRQARPRAPAAADSATTLVLRSMSSLSEYTHS